MRSWRSPYFYLAILSAFLIAAAMLHYVGVSPSTFKFSRFWGNEILRNRIFQICHQDNATEELLDVAFVKSGRAEKLEDKRGKSGGISDVVYNYPPRNDLMEKAVRIVAYVNEQSRVIDCSVIIDWETPNMPDLTRLDRDD